MLYEILCLFEVGETEREQRVDRIQHIALAATRKHYTHVVAGKCLKLKQRLAAGIGSFGLLAA